MYILIKQLYGLLSKKQKKHLFLLQIGVCFMSIFELAGIALIGPFIAVASDFSIIESNSILSYFFEISNAKSYEEFVLFLGFFIIIFLGISSIISMITTWRLAIFASIVGTEIGDMLFNYYLNQKWLFHANKSSSILTKNIATEAIRVSDFIIQPIMQINAKAFLVLILSFSLVIYNPYIAISAIFIFAMSYLILYKSVRIKLQNNGDAITRYIGERFFLMNEGFGGIKEVILSGKNKYFINKFNKLGKKFALARGKNAGLSQVPRYLMEFVAFGSIIGLIIFLLMKNNNSITTILPILSIYAFASLKILPAVQQIYVNLSQVKGNIAAFDAIKPDLDKAISLRGKNSITFDNDQRETLPFSDALLIENLNFHYKENQQILKDLSIRVPANKTIGIIGPSGSGKSTLIDIILGLVDPIEGSITVDGKEIKGSAKRKWQNSLGFVPQTVFLTESNILENIAFGIPKDEINLERINKSLKLAHLEDFVSKLPDKIYTKVGERGVQLSGGQRQRIAIARALYFDVDLIIFDEATSALDGESEEKIMDAIYNFHGSKTIIMVAHRLKTVKRCDTIFLLEDGRISDKGTYNELLESNAKFRKMSQLA